MSLWNQPKPSTFSGTGLLLKSPEDANAAVGKNKTESNNITSGVKLGNPVNDFIQYCHGPSNLHAPELRERSADEVGITKVLSAPL